MRPKTRREWKSDEDERLSGLFHGKLNIAAMALAIGRTPSAVSHRLVKLGMVRYRRCTDHERKRAEDMIRSGDTDSNIARTIGRSPEARKMVGRIRRQLGRKPLTHSESNVVRWKRTNKVRDKSKTTPCEAKFLVALEEGPKSISEIVAAVGCGGTKNAHKRLCSLRKKCKAFCFGETGRGVKWQSLSNWVTENTGLLWLRTHRIAKLNPWCEKEDVFGQLILFVADTVKYYRPGHGAKFSTYGLNFASKSCTDWAIRQKARGIKFACNRSKAIPEVTVIEQNYEEPEPDRERKTTDDSFWTQAVAGLTPTESAILLAHYRDDMTYQELSNLYLGGVTREAGRQRLLRVLEKVKKMKYLELFEAQM